MRNPTFQELALRFFFLSTLFLSNHYHSSSSILVNARGDETTHHSNNQPEEITTYGIDISFPIQKSFVSNNYPDLETPIKGMPIQPLGNRQALYNHHLEGCHKAYEASGKSLECDRYEYHRQIMNRRQPQSMVNLTETGFQKIRAPKHLIELIDEFWHKNKNTMEDTVENWGDGNAYVNHWESPTTLVSVDDKGLRGSGVELKKHIWSAASAVLEEWTEEELQPCSLYGIRVYHTGAIMLPHVDRLPLVASAIINVAQDLDEPWPWEVYDHNGMAHNVTLEPGGMLLFESHSVIHGHPFPLVGRYSANIYIHFEPTGHSLGKDESGFYYRKDDDDIFSEKEEKEVHSNMRRGGGSSGSTKSPSKKTTDAHTLDKVYRDEIKSEHGGQSSSIGELGGGGSKLPPYIQEASPEEQNWLKLHPAGWVPPPEILPNDAHVAAKTGQLEELKLELQQAGTDHVLVEVLTERDENGWQVLHQGVVGGNKDIVQLLVDRGADINSRTHGGYGETPLRIAEKRWGANNPISIFLKERGGLSIGPEL